MASNEHNNLLDGNRHYPLGYEAAENNTVLGKKNGVVIDDRLGNMDWVYPLQTFVLRLDGAIAVANAVDYMRFPYAFRLTQVRASVGTAGAGLTTIDIQESGVSMLSTLLTIDGGEKTSTTAATPVVISDYDIADDAEITIDITAIDGDVANDLKIYLTGYIVR